MIKFYSLQILINGIDRTNKVLWRTFSTQDEIDDTPNICGFEILKYDDSYVPSNGDSLTVSFNGNVYFSGKIIQVENTGSRFIQKFKIKAKDNTILLDRILITGRYKDMTVKEIITAICSDTRFTTSITTNNVFCDLLIKTITFNAIPASKCIQKLAQQINYNWYIDENNDIHFFAKNSENAPFGISDTSENFIDESFSYKEDISQLKNVVTVRGGDQTSEVTKTTTVKGDGTTLNFQTGYKFEELPIVKKNGVNVNCGVEYIDKEENFDAFWSYGERKVRFKVAPLATDTLTFTGYPLIPILVSVENAVSISQLGRAEYKIDNKSIRSIDEARQFAVSQLESFANSLYDLEFQTYEVGLRSGQTLSVNVRGVVDSFIIQNIDMTLLSVDFGALETLQTSTGDDIQTSNSDTFVVNAGNSGALVFPIFSVRASTTKILNMVYFLQKLLLRESDNLEVDENQLIDLLNLDSQNVKINEEIVQDPFGDGSSPEFVLGDYYPSDPYTDKKREGLLDISLILI